MLNKIFEEHEKLDFDGYVDLVYCYVLQATHRFPYVHEIVTYKQEVRLISLSSIHSYWRKLDLIPAKEEEPMKFNYKVEMKMTKRQFNDMDYSSKMKLL